MNKIGHIKEELTTFINCDKFLTYGHLQPAVENSTTEDKLLINEEMNRCSNELLQYLETKQPTDEGVKKIIRKSLETIEDAILDTEDREFCYELYGRIGEITGVSPENEDITMEQKLMEQLQRMAKKGGFNLDDLLPPKS